MAEVGKKNVKKTYVPCSLLGRTEDRLWKLDVAPANIYVAATIHNQVAALRFALQLQDAGFCVTSNWLRKDFSCLPNPENDWPDYKALMEKMGRVDCADLERSDTLIIIADMPSATGGFHVELGYFLGAKRTNIIVVGGVRPNVFYWTDSVRWTRNTDGLIEWLLDSAHGKVEGPPSTQFAEEIAF